MLKTDISGALKISKQLGLLMLPVNKRRKLLKKIGLGIRKKSRVRIRQQKNIDGSPFENRKKANRKKMLTGLNRFMTVSVKNRQVDIGFNNAVIGRIAREHHEGLKRTMTRRELQRQQGNVDYTSPATRSQAKKLRALGFKTNRLRGKGYKAPSLKWITENLTLGQAGFISRQMGNGAAKKQWRIELPARNILGATQPDINQLITQLLKDIKQP